MSSLFGLSMNTLVHILLVVVIGITVVVAFLAARNFLFLKLGLRNIPRRRAQSILIIFGLMLSTVIITSAFGTGDTLSYSIRGIATNSLGSVDETIVKHNVSNGGRVFERQAATGSPFFSQAEVARVSRSVGTADTDGVVGVILESAPLRDLTSRQEKSVSDVMALPVNYPSSFGLLSNTAGNAVEMSQLGPDQIYLSQRAAYALNAKPGDRVQVFANGVRIPSVVRDVVTNDGLASGGLLGFSNPDPVVLMPLNRLQRLIGHPGQITHILISNTGDALSGANLSDKVTTNLRDYLANATEVARVKRLLGTPIALAALQVAGNNGTFDRRAASKIDDLRLQLQKPGITSKLKDLLTDPSVTDALKSLQLPAGAGVGATTLSVALDKTSAYAVTPVKQDVLDAADAAGSVFTTLFLAFGLFSIAAGILLIFLIFVMLAAERRAEMGMARAVGTKRRHLIQQFLFEGYIYDLGSAIVGAVIGIAVALIMVSIMASLFASGSDFTLIRHIEPRSLTVAFCLGALATFITVAVSCWWVSRLNIVAAIRDLPEDLHKEKSIAAAFRRPWTDLKNAGIRLRRKSIRSGLAALIASPWHVFTAFRVFITRGPVLLILGFFLFSLGGNTKQLFPFSLGISLMLIGGALLLRWVLVAFHVPDRIRNRLGYSLAGVTLIVFWLLPFDFFRSDLSFGIEMFFLAGMLLMLGGVWTVMYNIDLLLGGLLLIVGGLGRITPIVRTAITYPTQHRLRTGLTLFMFSLVVFALMVQAVLFGSFSSQTLNLNRDFGGYAAYGFIAPTSPIRDAQATVNANPGLHKLVDGVGGVARMDFGVRQPRQQDQSWTNVTADVVDTSYLHSTRFTLHSRAVGFNSDQQVWQALLAHPGYAVVDGGMVPSKNAHTGGGVSNYQLSGIHYEDQTFKPVALDMQDHRNGKIVHVMVIGVLDIAALNLDNTDGVYTSRATLTDQGDSPPASTLYFFHVAPGQDVHQAALALGSAFLAHGLDVKETQAVFDSNRSIELGFRNLLEGFMALGLIVGIAAVGVIATRSVVERRQEIGMMRAIGFQRSMIRNAFLLESSFISLLGTLLGVVLGVLLSSNVIAYEAKNDPSLHMVIPWITIAGVVVLTYFASLATTFLPAWQASRIYPAEALRYE